ncbi:hypothetical protein [Nonomuraea rubra]|uniref:Uncharacterized protein n=1 Tax=Nonomuraea rubra TaxID=46180 RepID=A0A7X0NTQ7_9ACTN|nr:hypothetical protein [Nonomuraea rubra]MBB6549385.1 hypothetical protein [Nonomuraea rubra]
MSYPSQPHPDDPWGQQAPPPNGRPGHGPATPPPGYGAWGGAAHGQGAGRPEPGPQPRQGGPPPDYGRRPEYGPTSGQNRWPGQDRRPEYGPPPDQDWWPEQERWPEQAPMPGPGLASGPYASRPEFPTTYADQGDPYGLPQNPYEFGGLPPKRHNTLIIGLSAALGVILLLGGTAGAIAYFNASRTETTSGLSGTGTSGPTTAPLESPSSEPSEDPAGDATGDPAGDAAEEPAEEPTGSADPPSDTTPGSSRAAPGSPITHSEFGDWNFRFEGVKFSANKVGGWSYDTCDPVDGEGVLSRNKCERAIQVAYSAYRGHLRAVQVTMAFPTDKAAKAAATRLAKLDSNAVNIRTDMTLDTFAYGQIRANVAKNYVIATIVTADKTAKPRADKFHLYLQADAMSYFLLRDVTVTS